MHKILYTLLTLLLLLLYPCFSYSQDFHEEDKEGLRRILRQPSSTSGRLNLECFGLVFADTIQWYSSEAWIGKIQSTIGQAYIDWEWDNNHPSRLKRLEIRAFNEDSDEGRPAGVLDGRFFAHLEILVCEDNRFTELIVNDCPLLEKLNCSSNRLEKLDVSKNWLLAVLKCSGNRLNELVVTSNLNLRVLDCSDNSINVLDLSKQAELRELYCAGNQLKEIGLADNRQLTKLNCSDNLLTNLDLSQNMFIRFLSCSGNPLDSPLNLAPNKELKALYTAGNNLNQLDISSASGLELLYCPYNDLTSLDASQNSKLEYLYCFENSLRLSTFSFSAEQIHKAFAAHPQQIYSFGDVMCHETIDLSSEHTIQGNTTDFSWTTDTDNLLAVVDMGNGRFMVDTKYIDRDQKIFCEMSNPSFPGFNVKYEFNLIYKSVSDIESTGDLSGDIKLYPTHVEDFLTIESAASPIESVYVYDISGRVASHIHETSFTHTVDMSTLPPGVYLVKVKLAGGSQTVKKIKKK